MAKYYDKYTSEDLNLACNGQKCISHGVETAGWYNDKIIMISSIKPWALRGGGLGTSGTIPSI